MTADYNPVEFDPEIEAAFREAVAAGVEFEDFNEAADFTILEQGANPFELIGPIIRTGHRMEFGGLQLYMVEDGDACYYFAGRKPAVIEKIRGLIKPQGS
jgi:hypothetical protein